MMHSLLQDVRYALRQFAHAPGFTLVAVVTLGIAVGANTAIFSIVNALLLRPPANVADPERIVSIWTSDFSGPSFGASSYPDFEDFSQQTDVLSGVTAFTPQAVNLVDGDETVRLSAERVSANYFEVLGVPPERGRMLDTADGVDRQPVVVISHSLWLRRFGGDPGVIGRAIRLNAGLFTVIGVAPRGFEGSLRGLRADVWAPIEVSALLTGNANALTQRGSRGLMLLGRLQPGISLEQASERFAVVSRQLLAAYPNEWRDLSGSGRTISLLPERASRVLPELGGLVVGFMALLSAVVGLVLLICCANVASLLLARATGRSREFAVRSSLGAERRRLVRQLMTESTLLALLSAGAGTLIALAATNLPLRLLPPLPLPVSIDIDVDLRVLGFTMAVALGAAVFFGLAPALHATRVDTWSALKQGGIGRLGRKRFRLRDLLVTTQVAMSLVLLVGASLFLRSLQHAATVDPGFDPENVVVASFDLQTQGYSEAQARAFYEQLSERAAALPGARGVTLARNIPLSGDGGRRSAGVEGYEPQPGEDMEFYFNVVGPEYFDVMRVPIVRGRGFAASDRAGSTQVAVVNESFARRFWPGESAIGKRISQFGVGSIEVVGIARDGKYETLAEAPRPYIFRPYLQNFDEMTLHVRIDDNAASFIPQLRAEIRALDAQLPILAIGEMQSEMAFATLPQRIAATLLSACSSLALLLAAVGLYGVVAYAVSARKREIGIRMALGASRNGVVRLVLGKSLRLLGWGTVIGLVVALVGARAIGAFLGGVSPIDPIALLAGPAVLAATALLASYLPARRAARVDPMQSLRQE